VDRDDHGDGCVQARGFGTRAEAFGRGLSEGACLERTFRASETAYIAPMRDEPLLDLRRTQLLALDTNLDDARRALVRAARIPTIFAAELRTILAAVADLERRVLANTESES